jgi:hypothetical protein
MPHHRQSMWFLRTCLAVWWSRCPTIVCKMRCRFGCTAAGVDASAP